MQHNSAIRNLKLYTLTSVKTKNQNEKHGTTLPSCLDKALFKGNKEGKGKGETKENNRIWLDVGCN